MALSVPKKHWCQDGMLILNLPVLVVLELAACSVRLARLFMCTVTIT